MKRWHWWWTWGVAASLFVLYIVVLYRTIGN